MMRNRNDKGQFIKIYDGHTRNATLTVAISDKLKMDLKDYCKSNNQSVSNVVNNIIIKYLVEKELYY